MKVPTIAMMTPARNMSTKTPRKAPLMAFFARESNSSCRSSHVIPPSRASPDQELMEYDTPA
jgi:hypothetical protein